LRALRARPPARAALRVEKGEVTRDPGEVVLVVRAAGMVHEPGLDRHAAPRRGHQPQRAPLLGKSTIEAVVMSQSWDIRW
jgi:hypothetical protein